MRLLVPGLHTYSTLKCTSVPFYSIGIAIEAVLDQYLSSMHFVHWIDNTWDCSFALLPHYRAAEVLVRCSYKTHHIMRALQCLTLCYQGSTSPIVSRRCCESMISTKRSPLSAPLASSTSTYIFQENIHVLNRTGRTKLACSRWLARVRPMYPIDSRTLAPS